jgi:hypothetical protein
MISRPLGTMQAWLCPNMFRIPFASSTVVVGTCQGNFGQSNDLLCGVGGPRHFLLVYVDRIMASDIVELPTGEGVPIVPVDFIPVVASFMTGGNRILWYLVLPCLRGRGQS